MTGPRIRVARVYDDPRRDGDARVLVDRLWPRGVAKDAAHLDRWLRDVAPSTELRRWYGHRAEVFGEFARRYRAELDDDDHRAALAELVDLARRQPVLLLTSTKEVAISHLPVLADVVTEIIGRTEA